PLSMPNSPSQAFTTQTTTVIITSITDSLASTPTSIADTNNSYFQSPESVHAPLGTIIGGLVGGAVLFVIGLTAFILRLRKKRSKSCRNVDLLASGGAVDEPCPYPLPIISHFIADPSHRTGINVGYDLIYSVRDANCSILSRTPMFPLHYVCLGPCVFPLVLLRL